MISARMRSFSPRSASIFARSVSLLTAADELARAGTACRRPVTIRPPTRSFHRLHRPPTTRAVTVTVAIEPPIPSRSRSLARECAAARSPRAGTLSTESPFVRMCGDAKRAREARRRAASIGIARGDASRERRRARASRWTSLGVMDDAASARLRNVLYALLYRIRSRNSRYSFDAGARARERRRGQFHLFLGRESPSS